MSEACVDNTAILSTIFASSLLIISEVLPYFTSVKSNGITQAIISALKAFIKKEQTSIHAVEPVPAV